jgi:hypothetical protein
MFINYFKDSDDPYVDFINHLYDVGFEEIDSGSYRTAFMRGNVVIKVPLSEEGLIDNWVEAKGWKTYRHRATRNRIRLAPCRLLPNGCLMMVKVDVSWCDSFPPWTELVEGGQVGTYKGRVVAYDYALDLVERFRWEKEWKVQSEFFHSEEWEQRRPHIRRFKQKYMKEPATV